MVTKKATFAGGCFWGIQYHFSELQGVISTRVGYTGVITKNATYEQVCSGTTGHAEAVEVIFDPKIISYQELLDVFFKIHDPTQRNRQGPDVGTQYRSAIFYHDEEQLHLAEQTKINIEKLGKKIVTDIVAAGPFYEAETYHQNYIKRTGRMVC